MKCNNCGAELAEGVKFCGSCGTAVQAPVEQPVAEPKPTETPATETTEVKEKAKKANPLAVIGAKIKPLTEKAMPIVEKCKPFVLKNKLWFAGGACLLVLLITALIIIGACTSGNGFTPVKHTIDVFTNVDKEVLIKYDNKAVISTGIEAAGITETYCSIDGSICAFTTTENQLVVVKNKKAVVVADDVVDFVLSVNGNGIGYTVANDDETVDLMMYNVSKKKSTTVLSEYTPSNSSHADYALSPDGKSMVYYKFDADDETYTMMYFNGSKHTKITSNEVNLVGLSNKGKYIYVVVADEEGNTTLYSYNTKGEKQKIGGCSTSDFYFNEDHTQIMYYDGSKTMISAKSKEAVRISSNRAWIMLPKTSTSLLNITSGRATLTFESFLNNFGLSLETVMQDKDMYNYYKDYFNNILLDAPVVNNYIYTVSCDTLFNKVYICQKDNQYSAWLIKKNTDKSVRLVNNIYDWEIDESYEYLYYTDKDDNLMMLKVSQGERASDKAKQIAEDVDTYVVTSDRSKVYFTSDDALYSCNGKNGKSKKTVAAENVHDYIVLNANDVCFYIMEGDAYATNNGKKGKMVVADVDSVAYGNYVDYELEVTANGIVYIEADGSIYASKTNKKPTKIYSE